LPFQTLSKARQVLAYAAIALSLILLAGIVSLGGFLFEQLRPGKIDVARYADRGLDYRLPSANPAGPDVRLSLIITGHGEQPQAMVFRGGSFSTKQGMAFSGVLVRHPKATFLFEGGIGSRIQGEFQRNFNGWQKQLFGNFTPDRPLVRQLADAGVDPGKLDFLLLTHLHWDHAGVIKDLPGVPVLVSRAEHDGMLANPAGVGTFKEQFDDPAIRWRLLDFADKPFGPFKRSIDLFDDGSVVLVPLAGHTPGGLGMLITLKSGERYFFIGDVAWAAQAIRIPAERIPFAEGIADRDPEAVRKELVFLHELWLANPGLHVLPAHDLSTLRAIPELPRSIG
jgi:glyoxylase-like metal-dependent hydrolase (beta-lactamase superfamily II)